MLETRSLGIRLTIEGASAFQCTVTISGKRASFHSAERCHHDDREVTLLVATALAASPSTARSLLTRTSSSSTPSPASSPWPTLVRVWLCSHISPLHPCFSKKFPLALFRYVACQVHIFRMSILVFSSILAALYVLGTLLVCLRYSHERTFFPAPTTTNFWVFTALYKLNLVTIHPSLMSIYTPRWGFSHSMHVLKGSTHIWNHFSFFSWLRNYCSFSHG